MFDSTSTYRFADLIREPPPGLSSLSLHNEIVHPVQELPASELVRLLPSQFKVQAPPSEKRVEDTNPIALDV